MEIKEVFEPVLNFIKTLQKKEKEITSKQAAKDRLKLVLMQDRASVSPDFFEMMKQEIIDVIKKYIEIDEEALEVELTRGMEAGLEGSALYANIPIKNVKPIAPKVETIDETDELIVENLFEGPALNEKEADIAADQILNQLEESVRADILNDQIVGGTVTPKLEEIKCEVPGVINDIIIEDDNVVNSIKKKTTKSTTAKKKTTVKSKTTKSSTKTTTKNKKEN